MLIKPGDDYNNMGIGYEGQGNFTGSLKYFLEALTVAREISNNKGIANGNGMAVHLNDASNWRTPS